ncbi:MAG: HRDC domain-containing protein [Elusimicrobia bacterium]|nr:HRDC domain-containing protein [Elusimicrobiota bacterium]
MDPKSLENIPQPTLVTAREHLEEVVSDLKRATRLALDIESNGFYAYREKVCLLQISSAAEDYIVDPIAVADLSCLGPLMKDPAIEKIFHAGEYDVLCLKRDYGFTFANLFDTMIASRLLGIKELGLAALIERHFGLKLSKKLQRADWGQRPMTHAQIRYAQLDTHFLIALADILKEQLNLKGRHEDASEAFVELTAVEPNEKVFDPEGYWRLAARQKLSGPQIACLREIYHFREEQAQSRDRAHFRVMADELMLRVAHAMPATMGELGQVRGMTPYLLSKFGHALLKAVSRGRESEPPSQEPRPRARRDMRELKIFEALRQWRKGQASTEGVEPVVIMSSEVLREIARSAVETEADPLGKLSSLKRGRYGEALERVLKSAGR